MPVIGRYWIEPVSGAVHQTELGFSGLSANILETTSAPAGMNDMGGGGATASRHEALEGRATYAKYRRAGA